MHALGKCTHAPFKESGDEAKAGSMSTHKYREAASYDPSNPVRVPVDVIPIPERALVLIASVV